MIHDGTIPIFLRNFVDLLVRVCYLRAKGNWTLAIPAFEYSVNEHIIPIMYGKKISKPLINDYPHIWTAVLQPLVTKTNLLEPLQKLIKKVKYVNLALMPYSNDERFLTIGDLVTFLRVAVIDQEQPIRHVERRHALPADRMRGVPVRPRAESQASREENRGLGRGREDPGQSGAVPQGAAQDAE